MNDGTEVGTEVVVKDSPAPSETPYADQLAGNSVAESPPWEKKTETPATQIETPKPEAANIEAQKQQKKERQSGYDKRINELVREREYERAEKQKLMDLLSKQQIPAPQQTTAQAEGAPKLESFDSYEKYLAAFARFEAKAAYESQRDADKKAYTEANAKAQHEQTMANEHKRILEAKSKLEKMSEAAEKKYPDFYEKCLDPERDLPITPLMGEAILESDNSQDLLYYLGTHVEEAKRISALSPTASLRELGKIEAKLAIKAKSSAPEPISPIGGKAVDDGTIQAKESYEDFLRKRNKQLGRTR